MKRAAFGVSSDAGALGALGAFPRMLVSLVSAIPARRCIDDLCARTGLRSLRTREDSRELRGNSGRRFESNCSRVPGRLTQSRQTRDRRQTQPKPHSLSARVRMLDTRPSPRKFRDEFPEQDLDHRGRHRASNTTPRFPLPRPRLHVRLEYSPRSIPAACQRLAAILRFTHEIGDFQIRRGDSAAWSFRNVAPSPTTTLC